MYTQLKSEFDSKFKNLDESFDAEFINAYKRVAHYPTSDQERAIRNILSDVLNAYIKSKAKTRGGRWGRAFAWVGVKLLGPKTLEKVIGIFSKKN